MGRKSRRFLSEEVKKEKRCHRRIGESVELPGAAQQVRHHSPQLGRPAAGFAQEGPASRHILQGLAVARSAVAPRTETAGNVRVPLLVETEGGVHQPVPLQKSRESGPAAGPRTQTF